MKNNISLLFRTVILGVIYLTLTSQTILIADDIEEQKLKGKIKSLQEITWAPPKKMGNTMYPLDTIINVLYQFNKTGRLSQATKFKDKGLLDCQAIFLYDSSGRMTKTKWYNMLEKNVSNTTFTYNTQGQLLSEKRKDVKDTTSYKTANSHDSFVEVNERFFTYEYDSIGRLLYKHNQSKSSYTRTTKYLYNESNMVREIIFIKQDGSVSNIDVFHIENGLVIRKEEMDNKGNISSTKNFIYNKQGLLTKRENHTSSWNGPESIISHYEYDDHGNRIKETINNGKVDKYITVRIITYSE